MEQEQKDFCTKHNLTEDQFFGKEKFLGHLYLSSLTSIPKGFNPTVGGDLLPILEKKGAYGFEQFKKLVTF